MKWFQTWLSFFTGIHIPSELNNVSSPLLLHMTDTPSLIYSDLNKLIEKLSPAIIVHTGDVVDNIKLELYPNRLNDYKREASRLIQIMERSKAEKIFICPGNHDSPEVLNRITTRAQIVSPHFTFHYGNTDFTLTHTSHSVILSDAPFNLFGHDLTLPSDIKNPVKFLNGLEAIYVIELDTLKIHALRYPFGTNDSRLNRKSIGM